MQLYKGLKCNHISTLNITSVCVPSKAPLLWKGQEGHFENSQNLGGLSAANEGKILRALSAFCLRSSNPSLQRPYM